MWNAIRRWSSAAVPPAAAIQLKQKGIDDVVVLEREHRTGGILRQCIHDGFGLTRFGETLSGPEYAQRFVD